MKEKTDRERERERERPTIACYENSIRVKAFLWKQV